MTLVSSGAIFMRERVFLPLAGIVACQRPLRQFTKGRSWYTFGTGDLAFGGGAVRGKRTGRGDYHEGTKDAKGDWLSVDGCW